MVRAGMGGAFGVHMSKPQTWLLSIIVLAVVARLGFFAAICCETQRFFYDSDSGRYERLALNLLEHRIFSEAAEPPFSSGADRTPLYPLFLAITYGLLGHKVYVIVLIQVLMNIITLWLVYRIGVHLFSPFVGIVAAGILAVDVGQVFYSTQVLTEALFGLLFSLAIYFFLLWLDKKGEARYGLYVGILLGLAALCRPVVVYFPLLLAIMVLFRFRKNLFLGLRRSGVMIICFALVISPWLLRNYYLFGSPAFTSVQGYILLFNNAAILRARVHDISVEQAREEIRREVERDITQQNLNPLEVGAFYQEKALQEIYRYPLDYARLHLEGILPLFGAPVAPAVAEVLGIPWPRFHFWDTVQARGAMEAIKRLVVTKGLLLTLPELGMLLAVHLFAARGVWMSIRERNWIALLILGTAITYFSLLIGPQAFPRYRFQIMPYLSILAAYGLYELFQRRSSKAELPARLETRC